MQAHTLQQSLPVLSGLSHGRPFFDLATQLFSIRRCTFYSAAVPKHAESGSAISSSQLILLNQLGAALPSIARHWDSRTIEAELRNVDAANARELEFSRSEPSAVQRELAKRYGVSLGNTRKSATANLAAVQPPSVRSLAVLYGVLEYDGDVPATFSAARQLLKETALSLPHSHPIDVDLSPVAMTQMSELFSRLGYIGRPPFSFASAQLLAVCLRTILADVDDEARLRPLPSLDNRQADLIRYLRTRRAPPGTRGLPAVLEVDLGARAGVSRLAAARNILQLLQNHELSVSPTGQPVEALRSLGHMGPVPPTTGEALMLATELRDRCLRPSPAQLAALRAAGYGTGGTGPGPGPAAAPPPESVAHVKALLRVLRRSDTDAATPATRGALRLLADLRRRPLAAPYATAAVSAPWLAGGGSGASLGLVTGPGTCPSQLEVRAAVEDLPLTEPMMDRLMELCWSGPMPKTHGTAMALEDYLLQLKASGNSHAYTQPRTAPHPAHPSAAAHPDGTPYSSSPSVSVFMTSGVGAGAGGAGSHHGQQYRRQGQGMSYEQQAVRQQQAVSRLGSSAEEALVKIQIRGLFPGAVSEWYLAHMCREEAEHLLGCLSAARRVVLERVSGPAGYDEYVERWEAAEAEGDWWGSEWLWL